MMEVMVIAVTAITTTAAHGRRRCLIIAAIGRSTAATTAAAASCRFWLDNGCHAGGVRLSADILGVGQLGVLLVFHAAVLEPDLDLSL